jgi:putative FmdB family regulatory protein
MPTYDYVCDACQHKFELFQSIKDEAEKKCPQCRKLRLRRLFGTGAAIMFKGSGFYTTDYRSDSYKKGAKADSSASEGASGSEGKSAEKNSGGENKSGGQASSGDGKSDNSATKPAATNTSEKKSSGSKPKG